MEFKITVSLIKKKQNLLFVVCKYVIYTKYLVSYFRETNVIYKVAFFGRISLNWERQCKMRHCNGKKELQELLMLGTRYIVNSDSE